MGDSNQNNLKTDIDNILIDIAKLKHIRNYQLIPNLEALIGDGFVSQFYKCEIINKDTDEVLRVAIKKAPLWEWDYDKVFRNEIIFYEIFFPDLQILQEETNLPNPFDNIPEYFTSGLKAKKQFIAMEDLKPKGYILHDKTKCLNKEQLEYIFRTYGKFHALSFVWRKRNFEKYQEIHQGYTDLFSMFLEMESSADIFRSSLKAAVDGLNSDADVYETAKYFLDNIISTLGKIFYYEGDYRCSTHGDCWSNNMLFKYSDTGKLENLKLVDFQLARDGTPVHDLSYFFYSGAAKADFDALEDYLKIYHDSLSEVIRNLGENPEEIFPFEVLIKEWKDNALLGVFLGIYLWQIKLTPKEHFVDMLKNVSVGEQDGKAEQSEQDKKDVLEEATRAFGGLMAGVYKSDMYRERTGDILTHAFEYGILRKDKVVHKENCKSSTLETVTT